MSHVKKSHRDELNQTCPKCGTLQPALNEVCSERTCLHLLMDTPDARRVQAFQRKIRAQYGDLRPMDREAQVAHYEAEEAHWEAIAQRREPVSLQCVGVVRPVLHHRKWAKRLTDLHVALSIALTKLKYRYRYLDTLYVINCFGTYMVTCNKPTTEAYFRLVYDATEGTYFADLWVPA